MAKMNASMRIEIELNPYRSKFVTIDGMDISDHVRYIEIVSHKGEATTVMLRLTNVDIRTKNIANFDSIMVGMKPKVLQKNE